MKKDIIIYIPKKKIVKTKKEYEDAVEFDLELNFRIPKFPKSTNAGCKCYFAWNGLIRGYHIIKRIEEKNGFDCFTTGNHWPNGIYIVRDGKTLTQINTITCIPFRGFKYVTDEFD